MADLKPQSRLAATNADPGETDKPVPLAGLPPGNGSQLRERLGALIRAFIRALFQRDTYLPQRNLYLIFGLLWGLPVPFLALGLGLSLTGSAGPSAVVQLVRSEPIYWWFLLQPLLFAVVFGAIGTLAGERELQILKLLVDLRHQADTDGLTGLFNHRAFQECLREEEARALRQETRVSLIIADLDFFKRINDAHGHPAGDSLLKELADLIVSLVRPYDIVCRYGGEEFAVILPDTDLQKAGGISARIRATIEEHRFSLPDDQFVRMTISLGVATLCPGETRKEWLERADDHLYAAKQAGRNRVCAED